MGKLHCTKNEFSKLKLTEDGPVDDVGVGEPNLDRVFFVVDGVDDARHRFVGEGDVAVVADQRLEGERARHLPYH